MVCINPDNFIDLSINHLTKELQPLTQDSFPSINIGVTDLKISDISPRLKFSILNDSFSISKTFNNTSINDFLNQPQPPISLFFLGMNNSGVSPLTDTILNSSLYKLSDPIQIGKECDRGGQSAPLTFLANLSNEPQQHIQNFSPNINSIAPKSEINFSKISLDPNFSTIDIYISKLPIDVSLIPILESCWQEAQKAFKAKCPRAVIVLLGSILEDVLLNIVDRKKKEFNQSEFAPKDDVGEIKKFRDWTLNDLINNAHAIGLIKFDTKKYSHNLKDFRNYSHIREERNSGFSPDMYTAKQALLTFEIALADLIGER